MFTDYYATMSKDEAQTIIRLALERHREKGLVGPWSDQLEKVMTLDQRIHVQRFWDQLDGNTSFLDALVCLANGTYKSQPITPFVEDYNGWRNFETFEFDCAIDNDARVYEAKWNWLRSKISHVDAKVLPRECAEFALSMGLRTRNIEWREIAHTWTQEGREALMKQYNS